MGVKAAVAGLVAAAALLLAGPGKIPAALAEEGYGFELVAADPPASPPEPMASAATGGVRAVPNPPPPPGRPFPAAHGPAPTAAPPPSGDAPALAASFRGIAFAETDGWIPPDPNLSVGPAHVIHVVNQTIARFDKSGARLGIKALQEFFGTGAAPSLFDPKTAYDPWGKRFLVLALSRDLGNSFYHLAVSRGSSPTLARSSWRFFRLDAGKNGSTASGLWADYPGLGFDGKAAGAVFITSNQFSNASGFRYAKVRVLRKKQLYAGTGTVTWKDFWNLRNADGSVAFGVQPAQNLSGSGRGYLVNTVAQGGTKLTLWRLTGGPDAPSLARNATVAVAPYAPAHDALQPGGPAIDTADCRVMNAFFQNGIVATTFTHAWDADGDGDDQDESAVRLLGVNVWTRVAAYDYPLAVPGRFLFWPGIGVDAAGSVFAVFACSGPGLFGSACYTAWAVGEPSPRVPALLKEGEQAYSLQFNGVYRWGDFAGIARDPSDGAVWIAHEYAKDVGDAGTAEWETWIGSVAAPLP